ncbi:hypothetical protein [Kitasatospora sp. NPDC127116]|uniref:hypothetical protein n=1 Tax=Kitasatospora sp. NPDC127116 TaxID=3345367 RepID=UPI00363987F4
MSPAAGRPIAAWRPRVPGNTDLGTRLVCTTLSVERVRDLPGHGTDTVHGAIADQLASAALRLDDVQTRIVQQASALRDDLQRIIDGRDADEPSVTGILHSTPAAVDLLSARRTELHRALTGLIGVYRTLPPYVPKPTPAVRREAARTGSKARAASGRTPSTETGLTGVTPLLDGPRPRR